MIPRTTGCPHAIQILPFSFLIHSWSHYKGLEHPSATASASEATGTTHALLELLHLDNLGRVDALNDELGDAVTLLDLEVGVGVVEQQDLDLTAVVGINDAGAGVDEVFGRETGAGCDTTVYNE